MELDESQWGEAVHPYNVDRKELLALALRWDSVGRLALFPVAGPDSPEPDERCMLFVVPKPGTSPPETRQIIDRRGRNRKEGSLRTGSRMMPHACMWLDLVIPPTLAAFFSSNDLRHMYHAFSGISRKRARTMVLGQPYRLHELKGTKALERDRGHLGDCTEVFLAFSGLGMGDGAAVDIAEESHRNVIKHAGGLREEEDMIYRKLFPIAASGYCAPFSRH